MRVLDRLAPALPEGVAAQWRAIGDRLTEVRIRANRPIQFVADGKSLFSSEPLPAEALRRITLALMDYSFYTREEELKQGFFTLKDGSRVGVCGQAVLTDERVVHMKSIGSLCIRIARECRGCSAPLMPCILRDGALRSMLILSPPGLGKTTMLRDIARQLSNAGFNVGIADERHEIAACVEGVPTMDVGRQTDVMDGCPKHIAMSLLVRAMSPRVLVTDEIGSEADAQAILDAARCGTCVIASAHAESFEALEARDNLAELLRCAAFQTLALLGTHPGEVREVRSCDCSGKGENAWKRA